MRFLPLFAALALMSHVADAEEPVVGKHHPALRLPTIDGTQTIDVRTLAGKKVLLIQFASW